jgi:hypothetical protein
MRTPGTTRKSFLILAAVAALASVAKADSVADFYKGRSVSMIIGYSVGGGYDAYARLLAHYFGRHIPGEPSIVPQQKTGAGSLRAANYLFSVAPKDGSVLGTFSRSMGIAPLLGQTEFDSRKFTWLGSMTDDDTTCVTWNSSPIKTWTDFLTKPSKLGDLGADADPDIWALLTRTCSAPSCSSSAAIRGPMMLCSPWNAAKSMASAGCPGARSGRGTRNG